MEQEKKIADPEFVYSQSVDKQRVVVTGRQSIMISAIVIYILKHYHREFDFVTQIQLNGATSLTRITEAPIIIIQEKEKPTAAILKYQHHIGVISEIENSDELVIKQFADGTPKGGVLIYSETEPAQSIGKKERPGIAAISYQANANIIEKGQVILISHAKERFPIQLSGEVNLRNLHAAKEILKKIGITSGQFYLAISGFEG